MKDYELKPCPFCGGEAHIVSDYSSESDKTRWNLWHECEGHEGRSAGYGHTLRPWFETPWYDTETEAAAAWNRRAERTCTAKENLDAPYGECMYTCSECGADFDNDEFPKYCPRCGARVVEK